MKPERWFVDAVSGFESPKAVALYWALARKYPGEIRKTQWAIVELLREGLRYAEIRKRLEEEGQ